jgi:uncharacterized protein (TIGR02466 family)
MIKTDLFPTPFWEVQVPDINNSILLDYAYKEYEKSGKQMRRYHSDTEQKKHTNWSSENLQLEQLPELNKLFAYLYLSATEAMREFSPKEGVRLFAGPTWFNINPKGSSVAPHQHPGCVLAGVYYIKASGDTANLRFMHPDRVTSWMFSPFYYKERTKYTSPLHTVSPCEGKFVMFPGNLMHYVDSNESEEDRVSIAFNFIQGY